MTAGKESAEEKLTALIEGILDKRDARKAEEANPSLRGKRLAERMEAFLDEHEAAKVKPKDKPKEDGGDDKILGGIFG